MIVIKYTGATTLLLLGCMKLMFSFSSLLTVLTNKAMVCIFLFFEKEQTRRLKLIENMGNQSDVSNGFWLWFCLKFSFHSYVFHKFLGTLRWLHLWHVIYSCVLLWLLCFSNCNETMGMLSLVFFERTRWKVI